MTSINTESDAQKLPIMTIKCINREYTLWHDVTIPTTCQAFQCIWSISMGTKSVV